MLAARPGAAPVAFIPNGYDEDDFAGLPSRPREPGVFTLVHTGTFYGPRDPAGLLGGVERYLQAAAAARDGRPRLRVRLVGNMGARFAAAVAAFGQQHPGVVETVPYLPHREALAELVAADALVLVVGGGRGPAVSGWLPGKIFEYLRAGQPVLTLGDPAGDAAQLIARHGRGVVADPDDAAAIASALDTLVRGRADATIAAHEAPSAVSVFERRVLAGQLADALREAVARARSR
jgi:glycosyltransferase involved in cell wall biosynthesis